MLEVVPKSSHDNIFLDGSEEKGNHSSSSMVFHFIRKSGMDMLIGFQTNFESYYCLTCRVSVKVRR